MGATAVDYVDGAGAGGSGTREGSVYGEEAAPGRPRPQEKPKYGPLIDEPDEAKAFQMMKKLWDRNKKWHHRLAARWMQSKLWREGMRFLKMVEDPDRNEIRISQPLGTSFLPPVPNACDAKIRNNIAIFLADPPRPECEPWDDTPESRDAAHFATRLLTLESSESGLNTDNIFAAALDIAGTYGSAFTYVCYDPKGGGLQPLEIMAHPDAKMEQEAETGPEGAQPKPPVRRYVMPDGRLSKSSAGARRKWVPKLRLYNLNGNSVRFLPRNCSGIEDAQGVIFALWETLGDLKSKYPKVAKMGPQDQYNLVDWKVDEWRRLLPDGMEYDPNQDLKKGPQEAPDDDALVLTLHVYYRSHGQYPYGAYVCFGGGKYRLHSQPWYAQTFDVSGEKQDELLDIPIAQCRWWTDAQGANPYGRAPAEKLGPLDEMRAAQYASALEYLFRFSRPRPYLPMGTTVQPEDLADLDKPIYVPPGGKPEFPPIPEFPQMGMQLVDRIDVEMDNELSLHDPARGQVTGSVRSAEQQKTIIEQSLAGTAVVRSNAEDYYERLHRLILQNTRAFDTTPRLMRFQGDGGSYQVFEFNRIALGNTSQVRVRRGTFTLMAPTARSGLIAEKLQLGTITPEEAYRLERDNIAPLIGLQENPHVERVKRQLFQWRQGPPDELEGAEPQPQLDELGQPVLDEMGQPVVIDPLAQASAQIFNPLPVDEEPMVAMLRHQELSRAVSEMEMCGKPDGWNQGLLQAYLMARQAAGIQTVAEQQMMMQQQAEAQAQQQEQQVQMQREGHQEGLRQKQETHEQGLIQRSEKAALERELGAQKAGAPR